MKISIAIPCYEMNGRGGEMLQYSLDIIKNQVFIDFEVVIADHSLNNELYQIYEKEKKNLDIKYIRNENNRGSSSGNINCAIKNCTGDLIKILCQDDFLFGNYAIQQTVSSFDYNKNWLITSYLHTIDRKEFINYHFPRFSKKIYLDNLIGTHSCLTILNENPILFDENLIWFMDCEYYYRLYNIYGLPKILDSATVIQYLWDGQVTNSLITKNIIKKEKKYVIKKHEKRNGGKKFNY